MDNGLDAEVSKKSSYAHCYLPKTKLLHSQLTESECMLPRCSKRSDLQPIKQHFLIHANNIITYKCIQRVALAVYMYI